MATLESWLPRQTGLSEKRDRRSSRVMVVHFLLISTFPLHGSCVWAVGLFDSLTMVPFNETSIKCTRYVAGEAAAWLPLGLPRR